jgi:hypothetical protein
MSDIRLISHRGNIEGPNPSRENTPTYLVEALNCGVEVEVDVWVIDGKIFFGHDGPDHEVGSTFVELIHRDAWFHCKNLGALEYFSRMDQGYKFFWHQTDDYALTSNGFIWTYPGKQHTSNSIVVDLNPEYKYQDGEVFALCVDYI